MGRLRGWAVTAHTHTVGLDFEDPMTDSHVVSETVVLVVLLLTAREVARIRPMSLVDILMLHQLVFAKEGHLTHAAVVLLVASVDVHVSIEISLERELFATNLTQETLTTKTTGPQWGGKTPGSVSLTGQHKGVITYTERS